MVMVMMYKKKSVTDCNPNSPVALRLFTVSLPYSFKLKYKLYISQLFVSSTIRVKASFKIAVVF